MLSDELAEQRTVVAALSEIPMDGSSFNQFAQDQQFYAVLKQMENEQFQATHRIPKQNIDYNAIFGKESMAVLGASWVKLSEKGVQNGASQTHRTEPNARGAACTQSSKAPNYAGAIWSPAHDRNYGVRGGVSPELITVHTVQGSYASAISWFKNSAARVSAHYVIRSFDGQVTQMVCEKDQAYHVRKDNKTAIGIEHEGFIDEGASWYTSAMYESSAALVRDLCKRYNINPLQTYAGPPTDGIKTLGNKCTRIKGHQHFPGNDHVDPGPFWDWDRYYRLINPEPQPEIFTARKGVFMDPGGKDANYGDQARKAYLINPKNATAVKLTFEDWDMEGDENDAYDYLDIYDGENRDAQFLGRFTGAKSPGSITANSGALYIEFRSDCQVNKKGWVASYVSQKKQSDCPPPQNLAVKGVYPLGATLSWEAVSKANAYLVYLKRRNIGGAKWRLYKTTRNAISVTGLAGDGQYQWQIAAICNGDTSSRVGNNFITPPISKMGGAKQYRVKLNRGSFYDSGGLLGPYTNNEAFVYTISPPDGGRVELSFSEFETEADLDVLRIFDGQGTNSRMLGKFSGTNSPGKIVSSGNALTLVFSSDKRNTGKGWVARWKSIQGSGGNNDNSSDISDSGNNSNNSNPGNNTGTTDLLAAPFSLDMKYSSLAPTTKPKLKSAYSKSFTLEFSDKDKSGRGMANRFYNLVEYTPLGWRANPKNGFFYDDFEKGLNPDWKKVSGNWTVQNGRLAQIDEQRDNTNLYANVSQRSGQTYVYSWQSRLSGDSKNRRLGIHYFCSDPEKTNRGNSYFVWIRDTEQTDAVEIYEVVNDKFSLKSKKTTTFKKGKVYDFKVIYNPQKGRMEVYVNNKFTVSWVDPSPLKSGKAISLRSSNSVAEFDNFQIFHKRGSTVKLSLGKAEGNDIRTESPDNSQDAFQVISLVVDRTITWSPITRDGARVKFGSTGNSSTPPVASTGGSKPPSNTTTKPSGSTSTGGNSGSSGVGRGEDLSLKPKPTFSSPLSKKVWLKDAYKDDFIIEIPKRAGISKQFYLVAEHDGKAWGSNETQGFFMDEFPSLNKRWSREVGKWKVNRYGNLLQEDNAATNANIYAPLRQTAYAMYVYQWKVQLLSKGENARFGMHFFCSNPQATNRGDSYMVWFRNNNQKVDKVEIYRSNNNNLEQKRASTIDIKPEEWYDIKVLYDPLVGKIDIYINNQHSLSWKDPEFPLKAGSYISFRTGGTKVLFDDLRVYKQYLDRAPVGVGSKSSDLLRYKSKGGKPACRIFSLEMDQGGKWYNENKSETRIN